MTSSKNYSLCTGGDIDASINPYGIITSPNYPSWSPNQNCAKRINAPTGKVIRVYISDMYTEIANLNGTLVIAIIFEFVI